MGRLPAASAGSSDGESSDGHILVLVDDSGLDLVGLKFVSQGLAMLEAVDANLVVFRIGCLDVIGHIADTRRSVKLQGPISPNDSRGQIQVRQAGGVVRVQVRTESNGQIGSLQRLDTFASGGSGSPH